MGCSYTVHIWNKSEFDEDVIIALKCSSIGSKYFTWGNNRVIERKVVDKYGKDCYTIISETPSYEMGEVSFLKRAITGDNSYLYGNDNYVNLFDGDPEPISEEMIKYANRIDKELGEFLKKHRKHQCFTVCW